MGFAYSAGVSLLSYTKLVFFSLFKYGAGATLRHAHARAHARTHTHTNAYTHEEDWQVHHNLDCRPT